MDVRIDELSKVRIYSSSDKELCEAMEEESKVFVETLADFQTLSQRVTNQIKRTSAVIECEKQLAIGIRNAIEIEYEDRDSQRTMNHQRIQQKKDELNRLKAEYESLLQVLTSQESEIGMC